MRLFAAIKSIVAIATAALVAPLVMAADAAAPSFNRDIRPILAEHCLKCHSSMKEAGDLNLQFREHALKEGSSGVPGIVPGQPEKSALYQRLITTDTDDRMPQKADPLKPEQIALIKQWIAAGAEWQEHWAYEKPRATGRSIDAIVAAHLQKQNLQFSPEADRWTLARRAALDITGFPAASEEVKRFANDTSNDAYTRWVDSLLASPAYGERWASVWLDLARYADSKGYESDGARDAWRYRDWLIDAFNDDKPYSEFLIEQLAGDLLPEPTRDQLIATAFHRNTPSNDEGGTDDEEFRTYAVIDRVNTTFDTLQGTTIGCVQCHGHPYDPFVHKEFYQIMAFFNNTADADRPDEQPKERFYRQLDEPLARDLEAKIKQAEADLEAGLKNPERREELATWIKSVLPTEAVQPLPKISVTSSNASYNVNAEGIATIQNEAPRQATITIETDLPSGPWNAIKLTTLPHDSLPKKSSGTADDGNFIVTRVRAQMINGETPQELIFAKAFATHEEGGWPISGVISTNEGPRHRGWSVRGAADKSQVATFIAPTNLVAAENTRLRFIIECETERAPKHILGSFKLAVSQVSTNEAFAKLPEEIRNTLERQFATGKQDQRAKLERHLFSERHPEIAVQYTDLEAQRGALAALPKCDLPIMKELSGEKARVTKIFHRGNWMDKKDAVEPIVPNVLNDWPKDYPRNRLGFAKWLTNGENPLTARVHVNRIWEQLFGIGLVETLEDFGTQGDRPLYQDLLDELAARFQTEMRWSQKKLIREIMLSKVYRQSSKTTPELLERDPANRLLARGPRFRLTSEQLRDQALAISGTLSLKMFGPPVMPFQPAGIWQTPYNGTDWETSKGGEKQRRAVYTFVRRSAAYPSSVTFDAPSREFCTVRRIRTNTPLQSLDLLNNPVFFEAAKALGERMARHSEALDKQLRHGLFLALQRPARDSEVAALTKLHGRVNGNMTLVANAILNLDEVLNKN